jgi:hypothetical protein
VTISSASLTYLVLGNCVAVTLLILIGMNRALAQANWASAERLAIVRWAAVILIGWLGLAVGLSWLEVYRGSAERFPTIQFGLLSPMLVGGLLLWRSRTLRRVLDAVPQPWIIGIQLFRFIGVIFLVLYGADQMPGSFAWPAGSGDAAVGLLAPIVALSYARNPAANRRMAAAWNLFGIADLLVAVAMGFLTSPSPLQLLALDAPNELISAFPLVLIPVYIVPLAILLHVISLMKLWRAASRVEPVAPATAHHSAQS